MGEIIANQTKTLYYSIDKDKVQSGVGMVCRIDSVTKEAIYVNGVEGVLAEIISENYKGKNDIMQYHCNYKLFDPKTGCFYYLRCGRYSMYNQDFLMALDQLEEVGWVALIPFVTKDDKGKGWWHGSIRHSVTTPNAHTLSGKSNDGFKVKIDKDRPGLPKVKKTTMKSKGEIQEVADKTEIEDWIDEAIPRINAKLTLWAELGQQTAPATVASDGDDGDIPF